jgi:phytoene synthase
MDLGPVGFADFPALYRYCYRVAGAVGLACIHVWGFRNERAVTPAEHAGIALQLTNILRDLAEDLSRGRVYLPADDLDRFGCSVLSLRHGIAGKGVPELLRFEAGRARSYYESAEALVPLLAPAGRAVFQVILHTYRSLLDEIERRGYDVFRGRLCVSRWRKIGLVMRALPARWGLSWA